MVTDAAPIESRLRQKMLSELSKDDIRNKVRPQHTRVQLLRKTP